MGAVFRFGTSALGGLLFAWAALRSGGLALPIGLHVGGNWIQASVVNFHPVADSGIANPIVSVWHVAITTDDARRLSAPDLVPHLPFLSAVLVAAIVTAQLIRRWPAFAARTG